jgi:hypothetical protein
MITLVAACATRSATHSEGAANDRVSGDLATLRSATARFKSLDSAVAAGYPRQVAACLIHEHHGAMGYHHVNQAHMTRDMDVTKPQILLYERLADSTYRLNGVEFILPYRLWPRDSVTPEVMGQRMHQEDNLKFWYLHVWAWRDNPGGVFANFHPNVACLGTDRKVYTPFPAETGSDR